MKTRACNQLAIHALVALAAFSAAGVVVAQTPPRVPHTQPAMPHFRFENFTTANGLPDNHVYAVLVDGDRIWAGTENGLAVYENRTWKT